MSGPGADQKSNYLYRELHGLDLTQGYRLLLETLISEIKLSVHQSNFVDHADDIKEERSTLERSRMLSIQATRTEFREGENCAAPDCFQVLYPAENPPTSLHQAAGLSS